DIELWNCLVRACFDPDELVKCCLQENWARANTIGLEKVVHLLGILNPDYSLTEMSRLDWQSDRDVQTELSVRPSPSDQTAVQTAA
ncbi:Cytochrome P450 monooxygenase apf7, partial [Fusarium oxysporum f. sp. albedinis]